MKKVKAGEKKRRRVARPPKASGKKKAKASNPVLDGIGDESRCRVFHGGKHCENKHLPDSPFCEFHLEWVRMGRLDATRCPVFSTSTGEQCDRPHTGESGSGRGYCAKDYQTCRRGTIPGTQRLQNPPGESEEVEVSFRWNEALAILDQEAKNQGVPRSDLFKRHVYIYLITERFRTPDLIKNSIVLRDMLRLGLRDLLNEHGAELPTPPGALSPAA